MNRATLQNADANQAGASSLFAYGGSFPTKEREPPTTSNAKFSVNECYTKRPARRKSSGFFSV